MQSLYRNFFCSVVFLLLISPFISKAEDGLSLIKNSKSRYVIIIPNNSTVTENKAAYELQRLLKACSGAVIPVLNDKHPISGYEIIIGSSDHLIRNKIKIDFSVLKEDGFTIVSKKNILVIAGGSGKGTLYGVYTFLEKYLGFRLYTPNDFFIPDLKNVTIPFIKNDIQIPAIDFRALYYRDDSKNDFYRDWHKLSYHQSTDDLPGWGLWVHTFNELLPPSEYFQTHPEYYALVNGIRIPSQPCLSNPHVLEIVVANLKKLMAQNPDAKYWSVSQNDNGSFCTCPYCKAIDEKEGSQSGSIISFVNKVAANFPDKIISTLAYQYSRQAPQNIKPASNVNIMFCSIECNRSEPIATDSTSASFRHDMEQWSKLTGNMLVWDYVIQFKNLVSPFPNLFTLQPNIQYFVKNSVSKIFEEGNREEGGEFAALRQYLLAKLLWDPSVDINATMDDFLKGYYGKASESIRAYINLTQNELTLSGKQLDIFGSPVHHFQNGYLRREAINQYLALFDKAEQEVADDSVLLLRMHEARMPVEYALLTIQGYNTVGDDGFFERTSDSSFILKKESAKMLEDFYALSKKLGITRLHEWDMTPDEFYLMMKRIFKNNFKKHLAYNKEVIYKNNYDSNFTGGGARALTDAIYGTNEFKNHWQGFLKVDLDGSIDLGEIKNLHTISAEFLQLIDNWIFLPDEVDFYTSTDGIKYDSLDVIKNSIPEEQPFSITNFETDKIVQARYIRVLAKNKGLCPNWHGGAGSPCWMFADEIEVW